MSSDPKAKLQERKAALLKSIGTAAASADSERLLQLTEELRRVESLMSRFDSLTTEVNAFLEGRAGTAGPRASLPDLRLEASEPRIPGRGYGAEIRATFVRATRDR